MTTAIINTKIGESRNVARVWLEGEKLLRAGVEIGQKYALHINEALGRVDMRPAPAGYVGDTFTVSKRERNGVVAPLFEIRSDVFAKLFGLSEKVRVVIRQARIVITKCALATKIAERVKRFKDNIAANKLAVISLFHGGGVLDRALHSGLAKAGVGSYVQVGVELEDEFLDSSLRNNPELFNDDSITICGDLKDVNLYSGNIPQSDIISAGIPCTGASRSGRSKLKTSCAEEHPAAGSMFVDFLDWVKASNPAVCWIENVPEYQTTSSMMVIRSVLISLGYIIKEAILDGNDFGALERRRRMVMFATTPGIADEFSFDCVVPLKTKPATLRAIIEDIPLDSDRWKPFDYLAAKEEVRHGRW